MASSDTKFKDFYNDLGAMITGGETTGQKKIRQAAERRVEQGYAQAGDALGSQEFGATGDIAQELKQLESLYENGSQFGLTPEEFSKLKGQIEEKRAQLNQQLKYTPDTFTPTTDYDVAEFKPAKYSATSEIGVSLQKPELYDAPEYDAAAMQGSTRTGIAAADRQGMEAQRGALRSMQDVYLQGGMTAIDRARYEEQKRLAQQEEKAQREAILDELSKRGLRGGAEYAALIANEQASADRLNQAGVGIEGLAQQRALDAMSRASGMGRELASDTFNRAYSIGQSQDAINQFNTLGAREVQASTRAAQDTETQWRRDQLMRDVANLQRIKDLNVDEQTKANLFNTQQQILESRYGADWANQAGLANVNAANAANAINVGNAWNALGGYNTNLVNQGNLALGKAGAINTMEANRPTGDIGQGLSNLVEGYKTLMSLPNAPTTDSMFGSGDSQGGSQPASYDQMFGSGGGSTNTENIDKVGKVATVAAML